MPGFKLSVSVRNKSGAANQRPGRDHWQPQVWFFGVTPPTVTPDEVSIDTVIASVMSEPESISSLKEEHKNTVGHSPW